MKKFIFASALSFCASLVFVTSVVAAITPPPQDYPTSVEQCKKGGWEDFGGLFKNQGDCVSFVVTDGGNQPDGAVI